MSQPLTLFLTLNNNPNTERLVVWSAELSYERLLLQIRSVYQLPFQSALKLSYIDDQGDTISISSEQGD